MENLNEALGHSPTGEAKQIISETKNIYIIPNGNTDPDSVATALALFYTLKELDKNVNLVMDEELPENLKFLIPSLDFISYPKNFIISIPNKVADVSQIYYDKDEQGLKIHLTLNKGVVRKDDVSFYFSDTKPDLIITLGIKNFKDQMSKKMDSFGFLLDSPILNIDSASTSSVQENEKFGKINLIKDSSLAEMALDLVKNPHIESIKKEAATCFLTGLVAFTENFGNLKVTSETFETAGLLMKRGADLKIIKENLYGNAK